MSNPEKLSPDPKKDGAGSEQIPAAGAETKRPSDSVPVITGTFANLPARFGRYQVEKLLGRGAMGAVYLARDTQLGRAVALKIPKVAASGSKKLLARLETEAKAAARVDHQSLCMVYEAGEVDGQCFIAMQYIEGETLKAQLEVKSKSVAESISLIVQLAEGLSEAHALGIIHRDLKPENIMINRRGMPVIMDFGLAKFSTIHSNAFATQAGTILGSPAYMSPEQASGNVKDVDQRSDLYALGTIFFELLTGELPFTGSAMQILGQKSILDPASPLSLKPDLPPQVAALCHKMIARNSVDRYQTLSDVIADLKRIDLSVAPPVTGTPLVETSPFSGFVVAEPSAELSADQNSIDISFAPPVSGTPRVEVSPFSGFVTSEPSSEQHALSIKRAQPEPTPGIRNSSVAPTMLFQRLAVWWSGQSWLLKWTSLVGAAFVLLCGMIIITITSKDGTQTKIEVADTSTVAISFDTAKRTTPAPELREQIKQVSGLPTPDSTTNIAGWHGWPADAPQPAIAPFDAARAKHHQEEWAKYLKVDVEYTNSIGMKFRLIPPGVFSMGSAAAELEAALEDDSPNNYHQQEITSESPQHQVILTRPIYLGVNEVTQAQYEKVMGKNLSHFTPRDMGKEAVARIETTDHPVEMVSWNDAAEFCVKLSKDERLKPFYLRDGEMITPLDGTGYRIPSEAEWEFACRAGTITKYWIGDKDEDLMRAGWDETNSGRRTHAVGELQANPFGLADIHGNVWEWVQDGWDATFYDQFQNKPAINPNSPFAAVSPRVIRGGGYADTASECRSSSRHVQIAPFHSNNLGFRASLTLGAVQAKVAEGKAPMPLVTTASPMEVSTHPITAHVFSDTIAGAGKELVPGMKFRWCPAGSFTMGSPTSEKGRGDDEGQVEVTLSSGFWLGETEVTQGQWESLMTTAPWQKKANVKAGVEFAASYISHENATSYCERLTRLERIGGRLPVGWKYALPTEAQWEYGCRAGTKTTYYFGDDESRLADFAWYKENADRISEDYAHQVGKKGANAWGLRDMHGNVWEWCADRYVPKLSGGRDPVGKSEQYWVCRGGGWSLIAPSCRSAVRSGYGRIFRNYYQGFRVALVPSNDPESRIDPSSGEDHKKNTAARKLTDPLVRVSSSLPIYFTSGAQNHANQRLPKPLFARVINGVAFADEVFGRTDVICTHPVSPRKPAIIDFSAITKERSGTLTIMAHGYPSRLPGGGEVAILVNGKPAQSLTIEINDLKWHSMTLVFDHNDVVVEHRAIGWDHEGMFLDYSISGENPAKIGTPFTKPAN